MTHKDIDKKTTLETRRPHSLRCCVRTLSCWLAALGSTRKNYPQHKICHMFSLSLCKRLRSPALRHSAQFNLVHNSIFPSTVSVLCQLFWPIARVPLSPSTQKIQGRALRRLFVCVLRDIIILNGSSAKANYFLEEILWHVQRKLNSENQFGVFGVQLKKLSDSAMVKEDLNAIKWFTCATTINLIKSDKKQCYINWFATQ